MTSIDVVAHRLASTIAFDDDRDGSRVLVLQDPDGHEVEITRLRAQVGTNAPSEGTAAPYEGWLWRVDGSVQGRAARSSPTSEAWRGTPRRLGAAALGSPALRAGRAGSRVVPRRRSRTRSRHRRRSRRTIVSPARGGRGRVVVDETEPRGLVDHPRFDPTSTSTHVPARTGPRLAIEDDRRTQRRRHGESSRRRRASLPLRRTDIDRTSLR